MKTKNVWLYVVAVLAGLATPLAAEAACPYSSLQVRVQPNTQTAWG
jgi:hypothetical protein